MFTKEGGSHSPIGRQASAPSPTHQSKNYKLTDSSSAAGGNSGGSRFCACCPTNHSSRRLLSPAGAGVWADARSFLSLRFFLRHVGFRPCRPSVYLLYKCSTGLWLTRSGLTWRGPASSRSRRRPATAAAAAHPPPSKLMAAAPPESMPSRSPAQGTPERSGGRGHCLPPP